MSSIGSSSSSENPGERSFIPAEAGSELSIQGISSDILYGIVRYLDLESIKALAGTTKFLRNTTLPMANHSKFVEAKEFTEALISKLKKNYPEQVELLKKILSSIIQELQQNDFEAEPPSDEVGIPRHQNEEPNPINPLLNPSNSFFFQLKNKILISEDQIAKVLATLDCSVLNDLCQMPLPTFFEDIFTLSRISRIVILSNAGNEDKFKESCKILAENENGETLKRGIKKIANTSSDKQNLSFVLKTIGAALANGVKALIIESNNFDKAIEITSAIPNIADAIAHKDLQEGFLKDTVTGLVTDSSEDGLPEDLIENFDKLNVIFDEAIKIANTIPDENKQSEFLKELVVDLKLVALSLIMDGRPDEATAFFNLVIKSAKAIPNKQMQSESLRAIALTPILALLLGDENIDQAVVEIAKAAGEAIPDQRIQSESLRDIAIELAKNGNIDEAITIVNAIPEEYREDMINNSPLQNFI